MTCNNRLRCGERGFTYIALLIVVAAMGVTLAAAGMVWSTTMKREKEEELLFVGNQMRNALYLYYKNSPAQSARYPASLEDLLQDPRYPGARRYLRKIYPDPVSGSEDWGLVRGTNGEILGVHSLSDEEPLKQGNFSLADKEFEGKTKYSDWQFMIAVNAAAGLQAAPPPR